MEEFKSPLAGMDCSFEAYLKRRKNELEKHMGGHGLPDYAYPPDYTYRKKLDSIPGLYGFAKKLAATYVSREMQRLNLNGVAVGPKQFPEIYEMGRDCAKRLGIAIPNIYIINEDNLNAYTLATDDTEPIVVIHSLMLKRMTPGELKAVIGHECGHIQNYHGVYDILARIILESVSSVASLLLREASLILTHGVKFTLNMWSRAAEVTADRAALICCDSVEDAVNVDKKLMYGGVEVEDKYNTELDIEDLKQQIAFSDTVAGVLNEAQFSHPSSIKRVLADLAFAECETFFSWRPDMRVPGETVRSKEETDERCRQIIELKLKGKSVQ